jgi:hypothetical protein
VCTQESKVYCTTFLPEERLKSKEARKCIQSRQRNMDAPAFCNRRVDIKRTMGTTGSAKRTRHIAVLPNELMHTIFSKLNFHNKIRAGLTCKQWDQLLKAGTPAARHWDIHYTLKRTPTDPDATKEYRVTPSDHPSASIGRCAQSAHRQHSSLFVMGQYGLCITLTENCHITNVYC